MTKVNKILNTNIIVEQDIDGVFIVFMPGIAGAHADGKTLEQAISNFKNVISLLKDFYGDKKFINKIKQEKTFYGVLPFNVEYA